LIGHPTSGKSAAIALLCISHERDSHDRHRRQRHRQNRKTLTVGDQSVAYYSIPAAQAAGLGDFSKLPAALKVVLENLLRFEDGGFFGQR